MLCPLKNSRKFRCRSARHACEIPLFGSVKAAVELESALNSRGLELLIVRLIQSTKQRMNQEIVPGEYRSGVGGFTDGAGCDLGGFNRGKDNL
jgi:hypothetical protein